MSSLLAHNDEAGELTDEWHDIRGQRFREEENVNDDNTGEHEEDIAKGNNSVHRFVLDFTFKDYNELSVNIVSSGSRSRTTRCDAHDQPAGIQ